MANIEVKEVVLKKFTLELDQSEVDVLFAILSEVGGPPDRTRGISDQIYHCLCGNQSEGLDSLSCIEKYRMVGSINFDD